MINPKSASLTAALELSRTTFNSDFYANDLLQTSPNGSILLSANTGIGPSTVMSFDVSTASPSLRQTNDEAGEYNLQMVVSHKGRYFCLPCSTGNNVSGGNSTYLFSTLDILASYGELNNQESPGPLAFSPNDALIYQTAQEMLMDGAMNTLQVFDTQTFTQKGEINFPWQVPAVLRTRSLLL